MSGHSSPTYRGRGILPTIDEDFPQYWEQIKKWEKDLDMTWLIRESTDTLEVRFQYEKELGLPMGRFKCQREELRKRLNSK